MRKFTFAGAALALALTLTALVGPVQAAEPPVFTFRIVDEAASLVNPPAGDEVLEVACFFKGCVPERIVVEKAVVMDSNHFKHVGLHNDLSTGGTAIAFAFDDAGKQAFATITERNIGKRIAIVLDGKVLIAPIIREPIVGGEGQIDGGFTPEQARQLLKRLKR